MSANRSSWLPLPFPEMGKNRKKHQERSSSASSGKHDAPMQADSKNASQATPVADWVVPVSIPVTASPPGSVNAPASAAAAMLWNVSNDDILQLLEKLAAKLKRCRP